MVSLHEARPARLQVARVGPVAKGFVGVLVTTVVLEVASRSGALPRQWFPPVTEMVAQLGTELRAASTWHAVSETLGGWAVGLAIATAIAVPCGLLIGSIGALFHATRVPIEFLRPIPSVALVPLAVLVFGSGLQMKVFLVAFACTWPLLFQAVYGVRDVDPVAKDTARVYGLPHLARFVRVVVPSAAPYIATGLRISASIGLILAVTAELVVGSPGLGRLITEAQAAGAVTQMYALVIVTGLLGLAINAAVRGVERRLLAWHVAHREAGR